MKPSQLITCLLLAIGLTSFWQTRLHAQSRSPHPTPQAVIVAFENYVHVEPLKNPINSAIAIAKKLIENDYRVTVLTEPQSASRLEKTFPKSNQLAVIEVNDSASVESELVKWRSDVFENSRQPTPFGFIICIGHGEHRRMRDFSSDFLLTPTDTSGNGGVCIQDMLRGFGEKLLPVVAIIDMCRTDVHGVSGEGGDDARGIIRQEQSAASSFDDMLPINMVSNTFNSGDIKSPEPVLTMWSTQPGRVAYDGGDFISALAKGLERNGRAFVAREFRAGTNHGPITPYSPIENERDLSLFTWFSYAAWYTNENHRQQASLPPGLVDPMMICASTQSKFVYSPPPIDLLSAWRYFAPTELSVLHEDSSVTITRPQGATTGNLFAVSFFDEQSSIEKNSYDWRGKALVLHATAIRSASHQIPAIGCLMQPGDNSPPGSNLYRGWGTEVWQIPYGVSRQVVLPLEGEPNQEFKSMAISLIPGKLNLWPEGDSVRVTMMTMVDAQTGKQLYQAAPDGLFAKDGIVELLPRWWAIELKSDNQSTTVATSFEKSRNGRILNLDFKNNQLQDRAGRGGAVYRPPFVDPTLHELRVTVESVDVLPGGNMTENAQIIIQDGQENLLVGKIMPSDRRKSYTFPFDKAGTAGRVHVMGKGVSRIKISEISIVAK